MPSLKVGGKGDTAQKKLEADLQALSLKVEAAGGLTMDEKKKSQGFSCLGDKNSEKPDPYLLRLKGPKAEVPDLGGSVSADRGDIQIDVSVPKSDANLSAPKMKKKAKISGPSCLQGEKPDPYLLKLQGPKKNLDLEAPKADVSAEIKSEVKPAKPKFKGPSCLQGEKPDPTLLKLQGPKIETKEKDGSAAISGNVELDVSAKTEMEKPAKGKKFQGPSCLQGEKPDP